MLVRALTSVEKFFNTVGAIILIALMLMVATDVAGRYLLSQPLQGTLELTEFLMVGMLYFTLAHTQALKAHIRIDLLVNRLSPRIQAALEAVVYFLGLAIFTLILWQGMRSAVDAWVTKETTFGLIPFPTYPAKLAIPVGGFVFCVRLLVDLVGAVRKLLAAARA